MPVVNFHLVEGYFTDDQAKELLVESARLYAAVLDAPMERIRGFITAHKPQHVLVAGTVASENSLHAPFFEFIVLEGRSLEQRQALLAGFTDLLARTLKVDATGIRGFCQRVPPEDWGIAGTPASILREKEIQARREAADADGQ